MRSLIKKSIFLMIILLLPWQALAQSLCENLFASQSLSKATDAQADQHFKKFNPQEADSLIQYIEKPEVRKQIFNLNKDRDNMGFYLDQIEALEIILNKANVHLKKIKTQKTKQKEELLKEIQLEQKEIQTRIADKKITYYWVWLISLKTSAVKELSDFFDIDQGMESTRREELLKRLREFSDQKPQDDASALKSFTKADGIRPFFYQYLFFQKSFFILPTFSKLSYRNFLEIENSKMDLATTPMELLINHRTYRYAYSDSTNHDFYHILMMENDRRIAGSLWTNVHEKIYSEIKKLSPKEQRFTEYVYYYLIHEILKRAQIVRYLKGEVSEQAILDDAEASAMRGAIEDNNDDGQEFLDVKNKSEIVKVGRKNLMRILESMRTQQE